MERFVVLYGKFVESIHDRRTDAEAYAEERLRDGSAKWSESEWRDVPLMAQFWYRDANTNRWNRSLYNIQPIEDVERDSGENATSSVYVECSASLPVLAHLTEEEAKSSAEKVVKTNDPTEWRKGPMTKEQWLYARKSNTWRSTGRGILTIPVGERDTL